MADTETAREKAIRLQRYRERKTILTFDLGGKTGNAISENGKYLKSTVITLGNLESGMRFSRWKNRLDHLFSFHMPAFVAYEKVQRHVGTYAAHAYGAYQGMLLSTAYEHDIPVVTMSVGEIKKFITGKGNADKQMVIDAVNKRGHNITDDNEADAVAMLYLQLELMENQ